MATTIDAIMTAIGTRLDGVTGLRGYGYAPDNPSPPCAFPLVPDIASYRDTMNRGSYTIPFQVAVLTGAQLDRTGQKSLAGFISQTGTTSIRAALEDTDRTLGGIINDLIVDSFTSRGLDEVGLVGYYGGIFNLRISASGV